MINSELKLNNLNSIFECMTGKVKPTSQRLYRYGRQEQNQVTGSLSGEVQSPRLPEHELSHQRARLKESGNLDSPLASASARRRIGRGHSGLDLCASAASVCRCSASLPYGIQ